MGKFQPDAALVLGRVPGGSVSYPACERRPWLTHGIAPYLTNGITMAHVESRLTKFQLEMLHRRLEEERSRILAVLSTPATASYDERSEPEEMAQRTAEQDDRVEITDRERALLGEVERALEKFRTGTYGLDERTGQPISYERLAVIPWTRAAADGDPESLTP